MCPGMVVRVYVWLPGLVSPVVAAEAEHRSMASRGRWAEHGCAGAGLLPHLSSRSGRPQQACKFHGLSS